MASSSACLFITFLQKSPWRQGPVLPWTHVLTTAPQWHCAVTVSSHFCWLQCNPKLSLDLIWSSQISCWGQLSSQSLSPSKRPELQWQQQDIDCRSEDDANYPGRSCQWRHTGQMTELKGSETGSFLSSYQAFVWDKNKPGNTKLLTSSATLLSSYNSVIFKNVSFRYFAVGDLCPHVKTLSKWFILSVPVFDHAAHAN